MAEMLLVNPRKRKRRKTTKRKAVARRRPATRRRVSTTRRRRRNPIRRRGIQGILNNTVMPAAIAGVGAVGLDVVWNYAPVPEALKAGPMRYLAKAAGAIGLGYVAGMVTKKSTADQLAAGAMTVVMYQAMKDGMARFAPGVQMGEYMSGYDNEMLGYYGSGLNPGYESGGGEMGEYMSAYGPSSLNAEFEELNF